MSPIETLYSSLSDRLRQFIRKRVPDDATTDDILHDVFVKIHDHIDSLEDHSKLESWVFQITRNTIIDHFRRQKNSVRPDETIPAEDDEMDMTRKLAPSVTRMMEDLPEPYREALRLTEFEGLTQKELAQRLGISLSGAKSRVQRARAKLKDLLTQCCHIEFDRYGSIIDYHPISHPCCAERRTP
jgi:RNA polymerase sigma-70 factor (ECF subfamily)